MPDLPADLRPLYDAMDAADAAADALSARLTDEEFFWQPDERRWSVALCLDHLAVANTVYGAGMREAMEKARTRGWRRSAPARPGFFGQKFANSLEPGAGMKSRAPGKIAPRPGRGRAAILEAYRAAHDDIRRLIVEAADVDANRATFRNPFIPIVRVRVSTAFHVVAAHDRRHLRQASDVEQALRRSGRG